MLTPTFLLAPRRLHTRGLQAFFPGLQVQTGALSEAASTQAAFFTIWARFRSLPERFLLPSSQAHSSLKSRSALVMAALRNINSFVDCAPGYAVPARVDKAFERAYGEVSTFFSAAILNDFRAPDFTSHLAELKVLIMPDALESVCKLSKLALNVDCLSHFWSSAEETIRNTALEAYIRCVYRMHTISDVTILAKYSTRLLELRVDELQVKARISLQGLG